MLQQQSDEPPSERASACPPRAMADPFRMRAERGMGYAGESGLPLSPIPMYCLAFV